MKTNDDIESYLIALELAYETLDEGLWLVHIDAADIVVAHTPPVVVFRVKIFDVPNTRREDLFRRLLELNAQEMVHGAYGIEDDVVVLTDSLQSENLDANEFNASLESMALAVAEHHQTLAEFHKAA